MSLFSIRAGEENKADKQDLSISQLINGAESHCFAGKSYDGMFRLVCQDVFCIGIRGSSVQVV